MKKSPLFVALLAMSLFFVSCGEQNTATTEEAVVEEVTETPEASMDGTYVVDAANSRVEWKGTMIGMYEHTGTLNVADGKIAVENGEIKAAKGVVDMTTMVATDENYNPEEGRTAEKLIEHLSSDDFFLVSEFPTASFELTEVNGNTAKGLMTIRGNTNEVEMAVEEMDMHDGHLHITCSGVLDRQAYDVKFTHPMEEMVLSDDLEVKIVVAANKI